MNSTLIILSNKCAMKKSRNCERLLQETRNQENRSRLRHHLRATLSTVVDVNREILDDETHRKLTCALISSLNHHFRRIHTSFDDSFRDLNRNPPCRQISNNTTRKLRIREKCIPSSRIEPPSKINPPSIFELLLLLRLPKLWPTRLLQLLAGKSV